MKKQIVEIKGTMKIQINQMFGLTKIIFKLNSLNKEDKEFYTNMFILTILKNTSNECFKSISEILIKNNSKGL